MVSAGFARTPTISPRPKKALLCCDIGMHIEDCCIDTKRAARRVARRNILRTTYREETSRDQVMTVLRFIVVMKWLKVRDE